MEICQDQRNFVNLVSNEILFGSEPFLYNQIGQDYDSTRRADPFIASRLVHHLAVQPGEKILDLACGTGNYSIELAKRGLIITGLDCSQRMIESASLKDANIGWFIGDASTSPFDERQFSGAICTLAIHHFDSLDKPFQEVYRVIDRGQFVIFTASPDQMKGYWLNEYFPQAMKRSIEQMPSLDRMENALFRTGFDTITRENYEIQPDLQDHFLYCGKHNPELYLDPKIRVGISTFSNLANKDEVQNGCARLAEDIQTERINKIIKSYKHGNGDYLFVIARKEC